MNTRRLVKFPDRMKPQIQYLIWALGVLELTLKYEHIGAAFVTRLLFRVYHTFYVIYKTMCVEFECEKLNKLGLKRALAGR